MELPILYTYNASSLPESIGVASMLSSIAQEINDSHAQTKRKTYVTTWICLEVGTLSQSSAARIELITQVEP